MNDIIIRVSNIEDVVPSFDSIEKTDSTFQASTVTYNESSVQYNSSSTQYGGQDNFSGAAPSMVLVTTPSTRPGTVTLAAGQPMGLLLALTYPTTTEYII